MASKQALDIFRGDLDGVAEHFQQAIPTTARKYLTPERVTRTVLNALSRSPQLLQCTRPSVLLATMQCVQVGLEPGGALGHAYLVPFRNGKTGKHEATPIIGYKGYQLLAVRSGLFKGAPFSHLVRAADEFVLNLGSGKPPRHIVDHRLGLDERGDVLGGYCIAQFVGGGYHVEWMGIDEIDAIRKRSRARKSGPWVTDPDAMMRKTVIRRAKNQWPLSGELADAFAIDDRADTGEPATDTVIDQEFEEALKGVRETVDAETEYHLSGKTDQIVADLD